MSVSVKMYDEWIKESEQVDPTNPVAPPPAAPIEQPVTDTTGVSDASPTDVPPVEDASQSPASEADRFDEIDKARKEAIKAFKEKQKEYMGIPIETRQNSVSEEDTQKIEELKAELTTLNQTMKDTVAEYDKFNDEMLGITSEDSDVEP
jgi:hypothetical protein